jgi:hypothetical protein
MIEDIESNYDAYDAFIIIHGALIVPKPASASSNIIFTQ